MDGGHGIPLHAYSNGAGSSQSSHQLPEHVTEIPVASCSVKAGSGSQRASGSFAVAAWPEWAKKLYRPIQPWQTRLLRLQPGQVASGKDTALKGDLVTVILNINEGVNVEGTDEVVFYTALSYCWGSSTLTSSLTCNGVTVPITDSLASALRRLSCTSEPC
jgi:hypothetical protein